MRRSTPWATSIDFKFRNDTPSDVVIFAWTSGNTVYFKIYRCQFDTDEYDEIRLTSEKLETIYPSGEMEEELDPSLAPGEEEIVVNRRNGERWQSYKNYYKDGKLVRSEKLAVSTYSAFAGKKLVGPSPSPSASVTPSAPATPGTPAPITPEPVAPAETPAPRADGSAHEYAAADGSADARACAAAGPDAGADGRAGYAAGRAGDGAPRAPWRADAYRLKKRMRKPPARGGFPPCRTEDRRPAGAISLTTRSPSSCLPPHNDIRYMKNSVLK